MSGPPPPYQESAGKYQPQGPYSPGQPTAPYPQGQPSGPYPSGQPTGPYPSGQPTGPYPPGQPSGPYPPGGVPSYQQYGVVVTQPQVVMVGGCPSCRVGVLEEDFTCLGVCCAILFFPLGILCCLAMRQRRCPNCGAVFG
ncbi:hypothetical protein ScPMuIL_004086 [Solemya velum]